MSSGPVTIGAWTFNPDAHELLQGRDRTRLTPKAAAVLSALAAQPGAVVRRQALTGAAGLSDEGLSRVINEIREALGDDARQPRFVETIPRRGYRLLATHPGRRPRALWWVGGLVAGAVLGAWWFRQPPPTLGTTWPEFAPPVRLTAFKGAAMRPAVDAEAVWFMKRRPDGTGRFEPRRLEFASLKQETVSLPASARFAQPSRQHIATLQQNADDCVLQVFARPSAPGHPPLHAVPCRDASGGLSWSEDQNVLVFEGEGGLRSLTLASGKVDRLTAAPAGTTDLLPRFGPDGAVVFVRSDGVVGELFRLDSGSPQPIALTRDHQMVFDADWVDRDTLILSSDRGGPRELWLLRPAEQRWQPLQLAGGLRLAGRRADSGSRVVYERPSYRADILRWADGQTDWAVQSERYDNHPRLSGDELKLAFVSTRSGKPALWVSNPDGSAPRRLFTPERGRVTRPVWAGAEQLYLVAYDEQGSSLWSVTTQGSASQVSLGALQPAEVALDPNGPAGGLLIIGADPEGPGLFAWQDGEATRLRSDRYERLESSAAGYVVLARQGAGSLDIRSPAGAWSRLPGLDPGRPGHWTLGGSNLFLVAEEKVKRVALAEGESQVLDVPVPNTIGVSLGASADGATLYVSRFVSWQIDLMLLETTSRPAR
ncbi:MAG: winged helix-turn-helix domain-containing protein [Pseudomonadota bacterium]